MSFYESIAEVYDSIFPYKPVQLKFINKLLPSGKENTLLDVGTGTGSLALELAKQGHIVNGIDYEEAMVQCAILKAKGQENTIFKQGDMLALETTFLGQQFSLVYCLGNTLVHLNGYAEIKEALRQQWKLVENGGVLLFQVIQYDRIFNQQLKALPTISDASFSFERNYVYTAGEQQIAFNTTFTNRISGEVIQNSAPLYGILRAEIEVIFQELGVLEFQFCGNFKGEPLETDSQPLICVAWKA